MRDHDHSTGEYLGPACNECNLKRESKRFFLPLIFHNAKGYDMHPLLQEVSKKKYGCKLDGIPNKMAVRSSSASQSSHHLVMPTQSE